MTSSEPIKLQRACEGIEIPSGARSILKSGTPVRIMQSLGSSYTIAAENGGMYRIDAKDADAIGVSAPSAATQAPTNPEEPLTEQKVLAELKTVFDPEIPVNIVDLGLIYSSVLTPLEQGGQKVDIKMSMTAPGCGMADVLKSDVESKLSRLPGMKEVHVEVVLDPPWHPGRMSEAAKLQLGFDADYGSDSPLPIVR
jgi:probable FeS assembly SUF system protein SufT